MYNLGHRGFNLNLFFSLFHCTENNVSHIASYCIQESCCWPRSHTAVIWVDKDSWLNKQADNFNADWKREIWNIAIFRLNLKCVKKFLRKNIRMEGLTIWIYLIIGSGFEIVFILLTLIIFLFVCNEINLGSLLTSIKLTYIV